MSAAPRPLGRHSYHRATRAAGAVAIAALLVPRALAAQDGGPGAGAPDVSAAPEDVSASGTQPPPTQPVTFPATDAAARGTDVTGALIDSFKQLAWEHGIRVAFQQKTRGELGGPFWRDYARSIRMPQQWEDGDSWLVNYIGHPIHGASAGYSWIDHGPEASREIGASRGYWMGRARTLAWTTAYSLQFEFGPFSEASVGNVGRRPETTGWVDHVVTPVGAFGLIVAEDALDRYFVKWVERRTGNRFVRASLRLIFNPARTMSNTLRGRAPWHRPGRALAWDRGQ